VNDQPRTIDMSDEDDPALRTLLELGRTQATRPTSELRRRVSAADGNDWLATVLAKDFDGNPVNAECVLCTPDGDMDFLRSQYQSAKQCFHSAGDEDARMRGLLWYLLLMAAAAAHHDVKLSSQPSATVTEALLEVAPDLPDPWGDLAARGAMAMD
jgi:hypothetical protein